MEGSPKEDSLSSGLKLGQAYVEVGAVGAWLRIERTEKGMEDACYVPWILSRYLILYYTMKGLLVPVGCCAYNCLYVRRTTISLYMYVSG